jgi:alpha-ketoglutaric semialdehyde dehydrogenase
VVDCGLHEGVFSMLFDSSRKIGTGLVADARIQAVGFTGSRAGGLALVKIAQERKQPIPVYAEMSSINPVILLPGALAERGEAIGTAFAGALTLGSGQFCTNPGLVLALSGSETDAFVRGASTALGTIPAAPMLTQGIHKAYETAVADIAGKSNVETLARGAEAQGFAGQAGLFATTAEHFLEDHSLREEMFGAASLMVRCDTIETLIQTIEDLEGQLTIAIHATAADMEIARQLLPYLEKKAGRILFNGFGTGVEVSHAMVHGGPFPSTSDVRTTSVGSLAIMRFLRPVCYQDVPAALLPDAVADGNPLSVPRRVNGALELGK